MISATLMCHGMNPWVAMVITLVVCLLVGYVNGSGIKMQAATFHRNLRYNDNCKRYCTDRQW